MVRSFRSFISRHREPVVFFATCAALWTIFAVVASWAPRLLDDWYQAVWLQHHELTLGNVLEYTRSNYFNYNPRIGETFLLLTNGPRVLRVLLNASVELGLLFVGHALAFGRWPHPTVRAARRLIVAQALIWAIAPMACLLYFYRPFTTNYLYGAFFQLLLFVPYRMALGGEDGGAARAGHRPLLALVLLAGGWLAGMSNEHTGPAAIVTLVALVVVLVRRQRALRAWMLAGVVGLVVGYLMLYFAPGQNLRYAGVATHTGPLQTLATRGLEGSVDVLLELVRDARAPLLVLGLAALVALARAARRGTPGPSIDRTRLATIGAFVAVAGLIAAALMASPLLGERLYFASSVLLALAGLLVAESLVVADAVARRIVVGLAVLVVVGNAGAALVIYKTTYAQACARDAALRAAAPGTVGTISPFRFATRTRWAYGDDMRAEYLRTYVASEVYGLAGMEYAQARQDLQRTIPWRIDLDVQVEPPLGAEAIAERATPPLRYVPSRVDRLVTMMRKWLPGLLALDGHRLVAMTARVHGIEAPELGGRPVIAAVWQDGALRFVEAVMRDRKSLPYFVLYRASVPAGMTQTLIAACGRAVEVTPRAFGEDELHLEFQPWCKGNYAALACTPDTCWLAGDTFY